MPGFTIAAEEQYLDEDLERGKLLDIDAEERLRNIINAMSRLDLDNALRHHNTVKNIKGLEQHWVLRILSYANVGTTMALGTALSAALFVASGGMNQHAVNNPNDSAHLAAPSTGVNTAAVVITAIVAICEAMSAAGTWWLNPKRAVIEKRVIDLIDNRVRRISLRGNPQIQLPSAKPPQEDGNSVLELIMRNR